MLGYGPANLLFYGTDIPKDNVELGMVFFMEIIETAPIDKSGSGTTTASLVIFPLVALKNGNWPSYSHTLVDGNTSRERMCAPQLWEYTTEEVYFSTLLC